MEKSAVYIQLGNREPLKVGNEVFTSAFQWDLTERDLDKAARELGESDEKMKMCLRKLKEKLSKESNINYRQDDFYLLRFLRVRKYDVEKAYRNLKVFMEYRKKNGHLLGIPPDMKSILQLNLVSVLPYTDEERKVLFLINLSRWKPEELPFDKMAQTVVNVLDMASMNPSCQINGISGIYDFSGMTLRHITELLSGGRLWTIILTIQNGYPWRLNTWYILSTNRLVRFLYSLMKPFLSKKMAERCVLLGSDVSELHKYVNPALLPKSLKGNLEERECDMTQLVLNNLPYLRYERSFD